MNRHTDSRQRGFTLAEILVTTAIFAIVMIAALTLYDRSNKVFKRGTEAADMQQSTRIGFDKLVSDVRMAGFDYNRGGVPTSAGQFSQPDEQIEYAGTNVIAFRANFNYNLDTALCTSGSTTPCNNGLEPLYTPKDPTTGAAIFPFVTTSNNEIVLYALKSADASKNNQSISFWADTDIPRSAYPGSPSNGRERLVTLSGIDTTNENPPYTLYRFTVSANTGFGTNLSTDAGTPVAENIRALNFFYYSNSSGSQLLRNADGTAITTTRNAGGSTVAAANNGAIGGDGQYSVAADGTVAATTNFADRAARTTISTMRVDLTGMNANPDADYSNPTETVAAVRQYRQYVLSSLISPRNLGLSGFPEPSTAVPTPPTVTGICTGYCAAPVIAWTAPAGGGPVQVYDIQWDVTPAFLTPSEYTIADPTLTTLTLPDQFGIDPSRTYYYRVIARNDNGDSYPSNPMVAKPLNSTKPGAPTSLTATVATAPNSQVAANTDYTIGLRWTPATTNDPSSSTTTCTGTGCVADASVIPSAEQIKFQIYRGTTQGFDPAQSSQGVAVLTSAMAQTGNSQFNDAPGSSAYAPAACVQYYYRIQELDRCAANPNFNASGNVSQATSVFYPPVGQNAIAGQAYDAGSGVTASAPLALTVLTQQSACPAAGGVNCNIALQWPQVVTDSNGTRIGVDRYRITRERKTADQSAFALDTTFNGTGTLNVSGYSALNSGTITWTDTTAAAFMPNLEQWYYQYTVAANDCRPGLSSPKAQYPTPCGASPTIIQSGAASGDGSAANPWVFNAGDTVLVTPAAGLNFRSVEFDVLTYPGATYVTGGTANNTNAALYSWSDNGLNAGSMYYLKIIATYTSGCSETHVRYAQEYSPSVCAFVNQSAVAYQFGSTSSGSQPISESYTINNQGAESLHIAGKNLNITYGANAGFTDMALAAITYQYKTTSQTDSPPVPTALTSPSYTTSITRSIPNAMPDIAPGGSLVITLTWKYASSEDNGKKNPPPQPLQKMCMGYLLYTTNSSGVYGPDVNDPSTKNCNVVGQALNSKNPTTCD
jgi:prepilin-type N-terminal cleavage/methylation domain-containing protein